MCLHVDQCRVCEVAGGMSRHQQTRSLNIPANMLVIRRASFLRARRYSQSTLRSKAFVTAAATSALVKDLAQAADRPTGQRWDSLDRWVMFSDLHVSTRQKQDKLGSCSLVHSPMQPWTNISQSDQRRIMQNTDCCTNLPCVLRHSILSSQVFNIKSVFMHCRGLLACKGCTACRTSERNSGGAEDLASANIDAGGQS